MALRKTRPQLRINAERSTTRSAQRFKENAPLIEFFVPFWSKAAFRVANRF